MGSIKSLDDLGPRIIIMGPSGSGKSTLADAIARSRNIKAVHMDQFRFMAGTDWKERPEDEFVALHDEVIKAESWVIDGNYSKVLPQRLERATGIILLDISTLKSLWRYFRRSWFETKTRVGNLEGNKDSVSLEMLQFIVCTTPSNRKRWAKNFETYTIPKIKLASQKETDAFYRTMGLTRGA